jgi:hypothetical protein
MSNFKLVLQLFTAGYLVLVQTKGHIQTRTVRSEIRSAPPPTNLALFQTSIPVPSPLVHVG